MARATKQQKIPNIIGMRSRKTSTSVRSQRHSEMRREGKRSESIRRTPSWYDADEAREQYRASRRSEEAAETRTISRSSRELKQRQRTKERANRMFDRQFGDMDGARNENAPRAAVYKGKMGSSQRKASRMQASGSISVSSAATAVLSAPTTAAGAAAGAAGAVADVAVNVAREGASKVAQHTTLTPLSLKIIGAIFCVVFACIFLYTPAQQYYHAQREHDRLTAEYASIEARNEALNVQNDILASEAGIEDSVRQKFGYVRPNENVAIVTGLSEETTDSLHSSEGIEANVLSSSVKAPEEWYTPILDAIFGVE